MVQLYQIPEQKKPKIPVYQIGADPIKIETTTREERDKVYRQQADMFRRLSPELRSQLDTTVQKEMQVRAQTHEPIFRTQEERLSHAIQRVAIPTFNFVRNAAEIPDYEFLSAWEKIGKTVDSAKTGLYVTLLSVAPQLKDDYIKRNPEVIMDAAEVWDRNLLGFHRKFWGTSIPLWFAEGVVGKELAPSYQEISEKYPLSAAISGLVGDIANYYLLYKFTGGFGIAPKAQYALSKSAFMTQQFPRLSVYIPRALEKATMFGLYGLLDEANMQFQSGRFSPKEMASRAGKNAVFASLLAGPMSATTPFNQIIGTGAAMGAYTTLESYLRDGTLDNYDLINLGTSTVFGMAMAAVGFKGRIENANMQKIHNLEKAIIKAKVPKDKWVDFIQRVETSNRFMATGVEGTQAWKLAKKYPYYIPNVKPNYAVEQQIQKEIAPEWMKFAKFSGNKQSEIVNRAIQQLPTEIGEKGILSDLLLESIKIQTAMEVPQKIAEMTAAKIQPPAIPTDLEPLAQEARKYKSAEEFIGNLHNRDFGGSTELNQMKTVLARNFIEEQGYNFKNNPDILRQAADELGILYSKELSSFVKPPKSFAKYFEGKEKLQPITEVQLTDIYNQAVKPEVAPKHTTSGGQEIRASVAESITHNEEYHNVNSKFLRDGPDTLLPNEIEMLSYGPRETITSDGVEEITEANSVVNEILYMYSGFPLDDLLNAPISIRGTKKTIIDGIGSYLLRYHGLDKDTRNLLIKFHGKNDLRKEEIVELFQKEFPVNKEQAKLLTRHQENPNEYPIPEELAPYAEGIAGLMELSKKLQWEKGMQDEFFPESFIKRAYKEIEQHQEIIKKLVKEDAITRHTQRIEEIKDGIELLEQLRYVPHAYLASEEIQRNVIKRLIPEGKITSKFRDTLTKLRGREYATLDDAREAGLLPEEDIRVLLATHFEYLYRKMAIHDMVEVLKMNKNAVMPEKDAPEGWQKVAIGQLDGYKVNPFLVDYIEDFSTGESNFIARGYDALNYLGKALFFYNPLILPFWNTFQGVAAGSVKPWKPLLGAYLGAAAGGIPGAFLGGIMGTVLDSRMRWAFKQVTQKGEYYKYGVEHGVFATPLDGRSSPPVGEVMSVMANRLDEDYPGWKKNIEKITGREVGWKDWFIVPDIYKTNWKLTWFLDRVQRTNTLRYAMDKGMNIQDASDYTKRFHADYNMFSTRARKDLNRIFLVPTYKSNMMVALPGYLAKNIGKIAGNIKDGQPSTPEQKAALAGLLRIAVMLGGILVYAHYRGYHLREGYRLVKKLPEPEISPEGKVLTERVITLPGPFFEIPKLVERIKTQGLKGFYMYVAKIPQLAWGLTRNARWTGEPYYDKGAAPEVQKRTAIIGLLKDYLAPYGQYDIMSREEQEAFDNIMSTFGMATYKRGSTEQRIFWQIQGRQRDLNNYFRKPNIPQEDKMKAIDAFNQFAQEKIRELEDFVEKMK